MKKKIGRQILLHILYVAVIAAYTFLIGCPFYRLTKIPCPFCGMTRAHLAFLRGDFNGAMEFNRLFFLGIPLILCLAHLRLLKRKKATFIPAVAFITVAFVALIIRYILIMI